MYVYNYKKTHCCTTFESLTVLFMNMFICHRTDRNYYYYYYNRFTAPYLGLPW